MSRHVTRAWLLVLCLAVCSQPALSQAASPALLRVRLLATPSQLERALRTALGPWGMQVQRVPAEPVPEHPYDHGELATVARRLDADVLIWLSRSAERGELWLHEVAHGTTSIRSVPMPLSATVSAALALSIKTQLRAVLPELPPASGDVAPASAAPTSLALSPGSGPDGASGGPEPGANWQVLVHAALRGAATRPALTEARYALETRWAPWAAAPSGARVWFGMRADLGLPEHLSSSSFRGEYSELGAGLCATLSQRASPRLNVALQLAAGLHSASLSGTLLRDGTPTEHTRWGSALAARPEIELSLGALGLLLQGGAGLALARQRYADRQTRVLETNQMWWMLGGGVRANVD
jgi:hypothetical protein